MENFINEYQREHGLSPSYRQIMHGIGMTSLNLVQRYVLTLERQGKITRTNLGNIKIPDALDVFETRHIKYKYNLILGKREPLLTLADIREV